jgi:hypothetical protein
MVLKNKPNLGFNHPKMVIYINQRFGLLGGLYPEMTKNTGNIIGYKQQYDE